MHFSDLSFLDLNQPQLINHMDIPFVHFSGIHVSLLRLIPAVKEQVSFPPDGKDIVRNAQIVNFEIQIYIHAQMYYKVILL